MKRKKHRCLTNFTLFGGSTFIFEPLVEYYFMALLYDGEQQGAVWFSLN